MAFIRKSARTQELLGCCIDFLRMWLKFQFYNNMNWDNYGFWEIDHTKCCASFDLSDERHKNRKKKR